MRVLGTCVPRKKAVILQRQNDAAFYAFMSSQNNH